MGLYWGHPDYQRHIIINYMEIFSIYIYTLWLFNIAVENCPFIDDFPIKTSIYKGFSMAMLNNQMVLYVYIYIVGIKWGLIINKWQKHMGFLEPVATTVPWLPRHLCSGRAMAFQESKVRT